MSGGQFPPIRKDFMGRQLDTDERLTGVERRLARALPARLSSTGEEVTDWNNATKPGFYWSSTSALNNPTGNIAVGHVYVNGDPINPRVMQVVYYPSTGDSNLRKEWRRVQAVGSG